MVKLEDQLNKFALERVTQIAAKSTIQFFKFRDNSKDIPIGFGTGVLVQHKTEHFIFTNAHVIGDGNIDKIFINLRGDKRLNLNSRYIYTIIPETGKREDDEFDIGIILLKEHQINAIKELGFYFLDYSKILIDYTIEPTTHICCLGYPSTKTKIDFKENRMDQTYLAFLSKPVINQKTNKGFTSENHILIPYPRKSLTPLNSNKVMTGPSVFGMSGGGIWLIEEEDNPFIYTIKLLGIMMEFDSKRSYIIGTKIKAFTLALDKYYDRLREVDGK